jgi:hypothetical protein
VTLELLHLALLGGLLALDGTSVGQIMVSRPLVTGILAGWLLGDTAMGMMVGGVLEVFLLPMFPVGGAQLPEGGPATLVAVAAAVGTGGPSGVALGSFLGLVWSQLAAPSIQWLRRVNGRLAPDPSLPEVTAHRVVWGHLLAVALDFARGVVLTLLGLGAGRLLAQGFRGGWPLGETETVGLLIVGASVSAGAFLASLGGWRRRKALLSLGFLGAVLGSLLL